jgi:ABC-2 type transport system ATP-binding protein
MSELVVEAHGLVKRFGAVTALDGLDLTVRRGEVLGFLGPNGSGKTTAIRALLGQLRLDAGTAQLYGLDAWNDAIEIHERISYVPGDVNLWGNLTGGECIDALLAFHGSHDRTLREQLVERFELDPTKRARTYSKGNRQKVALVAALAADADLLILDEPTAGLDPLMEAQFQAVVRDATDRGRTVLLSSHILGEVEALCDRVTIIRHGKDVTTGTLDELRRHTATTVQATTERPVPDVDSMSGVSAVVLHDLPAGGVRTTARATAEALPALVRTLLDAGGTSLHVEPPSLDELFLEHYRDEP